MADDVIHCVCGLHAANVRKIMENGKRLSQNKLEMASVVSFQIEVIWISLKR